MPSASTRRRLLALTLLLLLVTVIVVHERPARAQSGYSATFVWTAPGDDGLVGRAARYDLRYSTNAISGTDTLTWWNNATVVNMSAKVPSVAGALDSMVIGGLTQGLRYFVIVRAADEVPNWSRFSNVASYLVLDQTAPMRISDIQAR